MSHDKNLEEQFINEASEVLRNFQPKMIQIWKQLGFPRGKQVERLNAAISHHRELWESMLEEEQNNKKKIVGSIDRLGRQYHQLCRELGTHFREFDSDAPLLEMEKSLQEALTELNREKEERMKAVRVLFEEEDKLRKRLGKEAFNLNRDRIPTTEQLTHLQQHLSFLRNEIVSRQEQYVKLRDAIREAMQNLEMSARSSFEVELFISEPHIVGLSDDEMGKIKDYHQTLSTRIERNQKKAQDLRTSIESLWERLGVESDIRELFSMENRGYSPSTLAALERELARLEELKRQNIERFIMAVRNDLVTWWDRCYVSESERASFTPYRAEVFTEELLELHEKQLEHYKTLYNENKDIFAKVSHRESLWARMEDIEARGRDPSRLFGNRGCALLQEEKERKKIMKELPRVESKLVELLNEYEKTHGQILLIFGDDYRVTIEQQWKIRDNQKENEKLQRQRDRAEKLEAEAKGGAQPTTPMKRRLGTTAMRTAMESPKAKQRKVAPPSTAPQPRSARRILTEAMVNQLGGGAPVHEAHDHSTISTYSAFTEALTRKAKQDNCRSSTVLESPIPNKSTLNPSTLPRRRSPRLAGPCLTPTTPVFSTRPLLRRSRTAPLMAPPCSSTVLHQRSPGRVTPSRSASKLTLSKNPRPFLV